MREKKIGEKQRQHRPLKITNYIFAVFFFGIGALMDGIVLTENYTIQGEYAPGTGFFPLVVGVLIMLASVLIAIQTSKGEYETKKAYPERKKIIHMTAFSAIVIVSLLLTELLGLTISLFLIFALIMTVIYRYSWWYSLLVSVVSTGIIYGVFAIGFSIRFPVGIFGF